MRRIAWRVEATILWISIKICGRIPVAWMSPLAIALAWLIRPLRVRRGNLDQNLRIAFPGLAETEMNRLIFGIVQNTFVTFFECARLQRLSPDEIVAAGSIVAETEARVQSLTLSESGAVFGTGHFGNWEWLAAWMTARWGVPFGVVYKPLHNPQADALLRRSRESKGLPLFSTRETPRALIAYLRKGGKVGMLSDQDARGRGDFIPFFGREASTAPGMAQMAVKLNLPMAFGFMRRVAPCRFELRFFFPEPGEADPAARIRELMLAYHEALETMIRQAPEQYFWWHRRWKTRPPAAGTAEK